MQAPPPYVPQQKKGKSGLIIALIIGAIVVCCGLPLALFGGAAWFGMNKGKGFIECTFTFQNVHKAVKAYADEKGKLPNAKTWQDDVKPYYEKVISSAKGEAGPFKILPADAEWGCTQDSVKTGIAFNAALSGKKLKDIKDPEATILLFEVPTAKRNLSMPYKKQDPAKSPSLMGLKEHRGWFEAPVEGEAELVGPTGKRARVGGRGGSGAPNFDVKVGE
jgi:hypothetical protein